MRSANGSVGADLLALTIIRAKIKEIKGSGSLIFHKSRGQVP